MEVQRSHMQRLSTVRFLALAAACLPLSASYAGSESLTIWDFASHWFLAGTAIPTYNGVVLSPGSPGRGGYMFKLAPLETQQFELSVTVKLRKPPKRIVQNDGFAIWYVAENATESLKDLAKEHAHLQKEIIDGSWAREFYSKELDLFGYKGKYTGLGVFFVDGDKPSLSGIINDGTKQVRLGQEVPAADALKFDYNDGEELGLKMSVTPTETVVEIAGRGTLKLPVPLKTNGFVGVSTFTGPKEPTVYPAADKSLGIVLEKYSIHNTDPNVKAAKDVEAIPKAEASKLPAEERSDVLHDTSAHKSHREVSDSIKDLTNIVFKLVVESQPLRMQMQNAISTLGQRLDTMEKNFAELKSELDKKSGHHLMQEFDSIKKELSHLSDVASKETQERHQKLESLHSDIADVHKSANSPDQIDKHLEKLTQSNSKVLDKLTSEHQMMFGVSIAAIAFIVIAGLSLYNKFRCWEKKHVL